MRYLLALLLVFTGCSAPSESVESEVAKRNNSIEYMSDNCVRLGECMGVKATLIHFRKQPHTPYACHIKLDNLRAVFLYPDANLIFGELGNSAYENAVTICEMIKQKGDYSKDFILKRQARLEKWAKERNKSKRDHKDPVRKPITVEESQ